MKYGVIAEPGNAHGYIGINGDFISNDIFVSQAELSIGDIIVRNKRDWFLIKNINIKDRFHFEYIGEGYQPNDVIHTLFLQKELEL